jgi:hypothetical protein
MEGDSVGRDLGADGEVEWMSARPSVDVSAMIVELEHLEHREREVSALRRRLHDRLDSFYNEVTGAREVQLSVERRELHARIDMLRAELRALGALPLE